MRPLVAAWRRGEGTQAAIAARHGMPTPSFAWGCQRLADERVKAPDFVAVDIVPGARRLRDYRAQSAEIGIAVR